MLVNGARSRPCEYCGVELAPTEDGWIDGSAKRHTCKLKDLKPGPIREAPPVPPEMIKLNCPFCNYYAIKAAEGQKLLVEAAKAMDEVERAAGDEPHRVVPLDHRIRIMGEGLRRILATRAGAFHAVDIPEPIKDDPFSNISVKPCEHKVNFYPGHKRGPTPVETTYYEWHCLDCNAEMEPVFKKKGT